MKKLLIVIGLLACVSAEAQTSNSVPSFFSTAEGYFTSFNTNLLTFQSGYDHFDLSTGTENWNNSQLLAVFRGDGQVYNNFRGVFSLYNDTTIGSLSKADTGIGYGYVIYDTKLTPNLNVGYDWDNIKMYIRPDLKLEKAMTQHTFIGVNIGAPIYLKGQGRLTPNYGVTAGFNF